MTVYKRKAGYQLKKGRTGEMRWHKNPQNPRYVLKSPVQRQASVLKPLFESETLTKAKDFPEVARTLDSLGSTLIRGDLSIIGDHPELAKSYHLFDTNYHDVFESMSEKLKNMASSYSMMNDPFAWSPSDLPNPAELIRNQFTRMTNQEAAMLKKNTDALENAPRNYATRLAEEIYTDYFTSHTPPGLRDSSPIMGRMPHMAHELNGVRRGIEDITQSLRNHVDITSAMSDAVEYAKPLVKTLRYRAGSFERMLADAMLPSDLGGMNLNTFNGNYANMIQGATQRIADGIRHNEISSAMLEPTLKAISRAKKTDISAEREAFMFTEALVTHMFDRIGLGIDDAATDADKQLLGAWRKSISTAVQTPHYESLAESLRNRGEFRFASPFDSRRYQFDASGVRTEQPQFTPSIIGRGFDKDMGSFLQLHEAIHSYEAVLVTMQNEALGLHDLDTFNDVSSAAKHFDIRTHPSIKARFPDVNIESSFRPKQGLQPPLPIKGDKLQKIFDARRNITDDLEKIFTKDWDEHAASSPRMKGKKVTKLLDDMEKAGKFDPDLLTDADAGGLSSFGLPMTAVADLSRLRYAAFTPVTAGSMQTGNLKNLGLLATAAKRSDVAGMEHQPEFSAEVATVLSEYMMHKPHIIRELDSIYGTNLEKNMGEYLGVNIMGREDPKARLAFSRKMDVYRTNPSAFVERADKYKKLATQSGILQFKPVMPGEFDSNV